MNTGSRYYYHMSTARRLPVSLEHCFRYHFLLAEHRLRDYPEKSEFVGFHRHMQVDEFLELGASSITQEARKSTEAGEYSGHEPSTCLIDDKEVAGDQLLILSPCDVAYASFDL
ncbi:hypothetical protein AKJ16_DCAP10480, partial [Drosera capensis]